MDTANRDGMPVEKSQRARDDHFVQFYEDDACLVDAVGHFVHGGLEEGAPVVVVATEEHSAGIVERLRARGHAIDPLRSERRLIVADAQDVLSQFMVGEWPDAARFEAAVGEILSSAKGAAGAGPGVRVFGEMVALLCAQGRSQAAVRLERLWNDLCKRRPISLFCAYPMNAFSGLASEGTLREVCTEHARVIPGESYGKLPTASERDRFLIELQRKALDLDREVGRRVELEDSLRRCERELADVLHNVKDGVLDVDPDGKVRWANRSHLALLGYGAAEYIGRDIGEFLVDRAAYTSAWDRLVRGQPVRDMEAEFRMRDGSRLGVSIHSGVLRTMDRAIHMRWFLTPVGERARA